jgi:hypothetical protein
MNWVAHCIVSVVAMRLKVPDRMADRADHRQPFLACPELSEGTDDEA